MEEEFLDLLLKLVRELPMADIYQMDAQPTSQPPHSPQGTQGALQVWPCATPLHASSNLRHECQNRLCILVVAHFYWWSLSHCPHWIS